MKKRFVLLFLIFAVMISLTGCGKKDPYYNSYNHLNFKEVLEAEEFELENTDYTETDDQINIYLFRGQGCAYCRKFISFLNSISGEYGKYFKVVSFEVWHDERNSELMSKVSGVTGVSARGVPYIIIGDKVFDGYAESYDDSIKAKIMSQYKNNSYDVFEELEKEEKKSQGLSNTVCFIISLVAIVASCVIIVIVSNNNKREILEKIDNLETKNNNNYEKKK